MSLIDTYSRYQRPGNGITVVEWNEDEALNELFVGRSVTKVNEDHLLLDDGTMLRLVANEGCGGCASGYYELAGLNGVDNVITSVRVEEDTFDNDAGYYSDSTYRLFVFADNEKVNLATFTGTDGNGYYGTGFWILVRRPRDDERARFNAQWIAKELILSHAEDIEYLSICEHLDDLVMDGRISRAEVDEEDILEAIKSATVTVSWSAP